MTNPRESAPGRRGQEEVFDHEDLGLLDGRGHSSDDGAWAEDHRYTDDLGYDGYDGYDAAELVHAIEDDQALDDHALDDHALDDHDLDEGHADDRRPPARRGRRRGARAGRAARRLAVLVAALALVAVAAFAAFSVLKPMVSGIRESNDYAGPGSGAVEVVVSEGDFAPRIGSTLEQAGVVKSAKAFSDAAKDNPASISIQPGSYTMLTQMKASDAVAFLVDSKNRTAPRVTLREGLWKGETFAQLSKQTGVPLADYEKAAQDAAALGLPAAAKGNIEGYLFPATYEFAPKASAAEQLRAMVSKSVAELTRLAIAPEQVERTMIVASIVEAEGRREEDRPKIARVIENRLAKPMRLQLDSTVSYGAQKRALTTSDAERLVVNGSNTYALDGLPTGPIGNPGAAAIEAAANPVPGPWLFFVAVNPTTGETKFAVTKEDHDKGVAEFQVWCAANKGQC